jgi:hypothetical protein
METPFQSHRPCRRDARFRPQPASTPCPSHQPVSIRSPHRCDGKALVTAKRLPDYQDTDRTGSNPATGDGVGPDHAREGCRVHGHDRHAAKERADIAPTFCAPGSPLMSIFPVPNEASRKRHDQSATALTPTSDRKGKPAAKAAGIGMGALERRRLNRMGWSLRRRSD